MFKPLIAGIAAFLFLSTPAEADLTRWNILGGEAKVCTQSDGGSCATLTCGPSGNIIFRINGAGIGPGQGSLSIDGRPIGSGSFGGGQGTAEIYLNPQSNRTVFSQLAQGSRLRVSFSSASVDVSLAGSANAISTVTSACTGSPPPVRAAADRASLFERSENEFDVQVDSTLSFGAFSLHRGLDVWGGDIRNGLNDPALRDVSQNQCAHLCLTTDGCGAFTHNAADGNVCFLKSGGGEMTPYAGATTGILGAANTLQVPPPTRGPLPIVNETVAWTRADQPDDHAARVRASSQGLGQSCEVERAILAQLMQNLNISRSGTNAIVGQPIRLEWSGNTLIDRIPVWIMVSSQNNVRFERSAAMVLGDQAPNPFGIEAGTGETRALVSLWGRGAGTSGELDVLPLVAGDLKLSTVVVAYLRDCGEELVLQSEVETLDVQASAATLVVGTDLGRADLTHQIDLPVFDRRIELSDVRFRLSTLSTGTEVIERDGTRLRLSPTGRFLLADEQEVIDLVDGSTVGFVQSPLVWAAGDSFLIGSEFPWGRVDVLSTFGVRKLVDNQITGPSCCPASPEATHIALDLENGLVTVRGTLGHSIGPIQGQPYSRELAGSGYNADTFWISATQEIAMYSLAPVAPITLATGFSLPQQQPIGDLLIDQASERPRQNAREDIVVASLFRGTGNEAVSAFERIGIQLAEGERAVNILPDVAPSVLADETSTLSPAQVQSVEERLNQIGALVGWEFDLVPPPPGNYNASDCLHFIGPAEGSEGEFTNQSIFGKEGAVLLPEDIQQVLVLGEGEGSLLIGRMECIASATLGALRGASSVFVAQLASGAQPDDIRETNVVTAGFATAQFTQGIMDHPIEARLFNRQLLLFAPGHGRAVLFDLDQRAVTHEWTTLRSGNLLEDAFLTADENFMVQMNSDGGFYIHRVADGEVVLSGRLVSGEIAVWTDNYRYEATAEAARLIDLRFPGIDEQFSLDRFGSVLRYDGLVDAILTGSPVQSEPVDLPPALAGEITVEGQEIVGSVTLDSERGGALLQLYQDGVLTETVPVEPGASGAEIRGERLGGARYASLLLVSETGLASNAISSDLGPELKGGMRRALAVAVDIYEDPRLPNLNYAKADADRFTQTLSALPQGVPSFEAPVFQVGRRVTPSSVLGALEASLEGLGPSDHLVFYLAGHGLRSEDGEFYFALSQTDTSDLSRTALAWSDISDRLQQTTARITILIDACHSGSAGLGTFATNDNIVSNLSGLPTNLTILAASKGRQQSMEARSQEGGLFTVAVERVLLTEREQHDTNDNGRIEAAELAAGVQFIVSTQSEGRQVPWMTKGRIIGDHSLF